MVKHRILIPLGWIVLSSLAAVAAMGSAAGEEGPAANRDDERFTVEIPFDAGPPRAKCGFETDDELEHPAPLFEIMMAGPEPAAACVAFLQENLPNWHDADGAERLVAPFVSYLLGDGTARGMQRHAVFIDLLGPLEKIAPDWRLRQSVKAMMPRIILGSVVEDPFVANFWLTTLREMDEDWRESEAARSLVPALYDLARAEEFAPGPINDRPRTLLRELSWTAYARLWLATKVFDTLPRRIFWASTALLFTAFAAFQLRRRRARG